MPRKAERRHLPVLSPNRLSNRGAEIILLAEKVKKKIDEQCAPVARTERQAAELLDFLNDLIERLNGPD